MGKLALTELAVKALRPSEGVTKHYDGGGVLLEMRPTGGKYWRYRFRDAGVREQYLTLGVPGSVLSICSRTASSDA
jgi:hypothetical protein